MHDCIHIACDCGDHPCICSISRDMHRAFRIDTACAIIINYVRRRIQCRQRIRVQSEFVGRIQKSFMLRRFGSSNLSESVRICTCRSQRKSGFVRTDTRNFRIVTVSVLKNPENVWISLRGSVIFHAAERKVKCQIINCGMNFDCMSRDIH